MPCRLFRNYCPDRRWLPKPHRFFPTILKLLVTASIDFANTYHEMKTQAEAESEQKASWLATVR